MPTHLKVLTFLLSDNLITKVLLFNKIKLALIPQVLLISQVVEYHYCTAIHFLRRSYEGIFCVYVHMAALLDSCVRRNGGCN
jgi:hypothetical protein